ncbi:MAG: hypothetical protein AB7E79_07775 [Rhodospirillaceae bacterium]
MAQGNFFSELKRRNVYRLGAAYAVAAFVLIEVVSNVAPMFDLPSWIGRAITLVLIIGFPGVLCFAWVYEVTPEGLKRTADVVQGASIAPQTGQRLNIVIVALMVVLAGLLSYQQFAPARGTSAQTAAPAPGEGISIAVLPFVNLSGDPSQEFFSDGMTEEITSALAKIKTLRVVGRTSAFKFKGQNEDLRAIGQALGASHILEGSVRKEGNQIRVTGQLIKADDGTHVWTENYDRELKSVFAVQDEVARAIAAALHMPLGLAPDEWLVAHRAIDPESYQLYLRARALFRARGTAGNPLMASAGLLEQVIQKEPDFAPAWALLAAVYANAPQETPASRTGSADELRAVADQYLDKAEAAGRRAIELDPNSADAYAGAANARVFRGSYLEMEDLYRQALKLDPNNPEALHGLSQQLAGLGKRQEAKILRAQLMALEPLVPRYNRDFGRLLLSEGQTEAALAVFQALPPDFNERAALLAQVYASTGKYEQAADVLLSAPAGAFTAGAAEAGARLLKAAPKTVLSQELPDLPRSLSFIYVHVGATDRYVEASLRALERQVDAGYRIGFGVVLLDAALGNVHATARFKGLAQKAGLVEYWRARGWPDFCRPIGADDFECD